MKTLKIIAFIYFVLLSQHAFSGCPYFTKPEVESCDGVTRTNYHASGTHLCHSGIYYHCQASQWISKGACSDSGFVLPSAAQRETSTYDDGCKSKKAEESGPTAGGNDSNKDGRRSGGFPSDGNFFENSDAAGWFEEENARSAKTREKQRQKSPPQQQYSDAKPDFESQLKEHEKRASQASQDNYSEYSNEVAQSTAAAVRSGIERSISSGNASGSSNRNCENAEGALLDLERYQMDLREYIRTAPPVARKEAMRRLNVAESGANRLRAECF